MLPLLKCQPKSVETITKDMPEASVSFDIRKQEEIAPSGGKTDWREEVFAGLAEDDYY